MPVPVEKVLPGKCYKVRESAPRRVLLIQDKKVTFILRGDMAWTVLRYHQDVESFARTVECEIDCMTLVDLTEDLPS
jgi:hypothetical protein